MGTITVQAPALAPALPAAAGVVQQPLGDGEPAVAVLADVPVSEVSAPVGAEAGVAVVHEARVSEGTAVRPPAESEVAAATTVREARISDSSVLRALLSNVTVTFNALVNPEGASVLPRERGAVVDGVAPVLGEGKSDAAPLFRSIWSALPVLDDRLDWLRPSNGTNNLEDGQLPNALFSPVAPSVDGNGVDNFFRMYGDQDGLPGDIMDGASNGVLDDRDLSYSGGDAGNQED